MDLNKTEIAEELLSFIDNSPTAFHAVENIRQMLEQSGIVRWDRKKSAESGYVVKNDSSLVAYRMPKRTPKGFRIMASHSDSPCFKIKTIPEIIVDNEYVKLNVEKYGGMILSTWMDRPLGIAGRVIIKEEGRLVSHLVNLGNDICVIPNLSIHFNRDINKGFEYNPQTDMLPLFTTDKNLTLLDRIAESISLSKDQILGSDLYLYSGDSGCFVGMNEEFLLAPRLDDLQCAYASAVGFLDAQPSDEYISVYCLFNNEEVGSRTMQGADSDLLAGVLEDIWLQIVDADNDREAVSFRDAIVESFLISADNAHALHPNHPEKSDVTNKPYLNKGIVLKFNGNAQYTTDGYSQAFVRDLCNSCAIPLQTFANRSDIPGGSTLGNIAMSHVSMSSADIGLPQLAMHSAMETAGTYDTADFIIFTKQFLGGCNE